MRHLEKLKPPALLLLRLGVGMVFLYHGSQKLSDLAKWTQNFAHMGFPSYFAYIAGTLEAVGGGLLIFGLIARLAGLLLAVEMAIACIRVDMARGSILQVGNYQLSLLLAVASFAMMAVGAGAVSLDYAIFKSRA